MTITSKQQAIAAIRKGQASQVLATLLKWRVADPMDLETSYLYAWALEQAGHVEKANDVWLTCVDKNPKAGPEAIPIQYSYELAAKLLAIWTEDGADDPIDQMIAHLNAAPGSDASTIDPALANDLVDLDNESTMVSPTFGRILVAQQKYSEAAIVYRRLAEGSPAQRKHFLAEADRLSALAQTTSGS